MQPFYRFDHLSKEKALIHAVSRKLEGEAYAFSLALHTGEKQEKILANRKHFLQMLSIPEESVIVVANQTHSDHIAVIEKREMRGWEHTKDALEDCDALVTDQVGVLLTILTADCVPILLYDPVRRVVAAVHAGWRGTEAEIVAHTVRVMMEHFGSKPSDLLAGVGPAIGKCCYEVGEEVASHFRGYPDAVEQYGEKSLLDLPAINREQMIAAGLKERYIEMSGICTACAVDDYFSYRKEQGCSGRFMSVIGLRSESHPET